MADTQNADEAGSSATHKTDQDTPARPLVAPSRRLRLGAPWRWLHLAWQDFQRARGVSLTLGVVIMVVSMVVALVAWWLGRFALLAVLLSGFVFVAPMLGVSLYAVSRALALGKEPTLDKSLQAAERVAGQAGVFAVLQGILVLLWSRAGMMVTAFFPVRESEQDAFWQALKSGQWDVAFAPDGAAGQLLRFLLLGSAFGSIFALICFAITAFALPMLIDRKVDMITASLTSINACLRNKLVMLQWAAMIVLLTGLGFATGFLGFVVIMPLLGYAAWHAYKEAIDPRDWPAHEEVDYTPPLG